MPDWILIWLAGMQRELLSTLAGALRSGSWHAPAFAFALGGLHALTPGHGKAALASFLLGNDSAFGRGLRIALSASLLHVFSGFALFLVGRLLLGQAPSMLGRGSPSFTVVGYGLIVLAGLLMLWQSLRPSPSHTHAGSGMITAGMGLLPCPLTISVLGFAWLQGSMGMVVLVLVAITLGIATTLGLVALLAVAGRSLAGAAVLSRLSQFERAARIAQGIAGLAIVAIGLLTMLRALR